MILPVEEGLAFPTFYPATVLCFYLCGTGGALLVTLSAITGFYIFTPPYWEFSHQPKGEIATATFLMSASLIGMIVHRMQHSAKQVRETLTALNKSDQRYLSLLEDQTEMICRFDSDGVLLYVNDAFCRFFGKPREALIGQKWHPEAHPEDLSLINEKLNTLSPTHPVVKIENRVVAAEGVIRWGQFVNQAFFDTVGRLVEMQSVGRDITDQKKAQETMDQLNKLIHHISTRYRASSFNTNCGPMAVPASPMPVKRSVTFFTWRRKRSKRVPRLRMQWYTRRIMMGSSRQSSNRQIRLSRGKRNIVCVFRMVAYGGYMVMHCRNGKRMARSSGMGLSPT